MTLHLSKDFLAKHASAATVLSRHYNLCITAYFLVGVMGFGVVGQTSFNINSGSITKGSGVNSANINMGAGLERAVQIPSGSYVVTASDIDRVWALKSNSNPLMNSGIFRVGGIDTGTNSLIMVARSWLDFPIVETGVSWKIFENEGIVTTGFSIGANANPNAGALTKYRGDGTATCSRIILQSPHSTGWQVRICAETDADCNTGLIRAASSIAPGFGGNAAGDFANGGQYLHQAQFWNLGDDNTHNSRIPGSVPGLCSFASGTPSRYYMWCDDVTGTCMIVVRQHGDPNTESFVVFGLPEDEEQPLPVNPIHRLFVWGSTYHNAGSNNSAIHLKTDALVNSNTPVLSSMGVAFGLGFQPVTCAPGSWAYSTGQAVNAGLLNNATAADDVALGASTLCGLDLYAGTWDNTYINGGAAFQSLEPRRLGRMPFARRGRENYNAWSTSVDQSRSYLHLAQGVYCPWSGSIIP